MKKIMVLFGMLIMMMGMVYGAITVVDDFNHPDGAITTSSQNNLSYNYISNACDYLDNEIRCDAENNRNYMNVTDGMILSFDYKCDAGECRFSFGSVNDSGNYYFDFVAGNGGVDGVHYIYAGGVGNYFVVNLDHTVYHHVEFLYDFSEKSINLTIDDVSYGNYTTLWNMYEFQFYEIRHLAGGGATFFVDNLTLDTGCTADWVCSGYDSCNASDVAPCDNVTDNNACAEAYAGDYSEFIAQPCNYCQYDLSFVSETVCDSVTDLKQVTYTDNNFATCCNVTLLGSDCYFGSEETGYINESCSIHSYTADDIGEATINAIATAFIFIGKIAIVLIIIFGIGYFGVRKGWFK